MRFCRGHEKIAAISVTGVVFVWELTAADGEVKAEVVLSHTPPVPPDASGSAGPCLAIFASSELLCTHINGASLQLWRLGAAEQTEPCASSAIPTVAPVSALGFSEDALIVGCTSGEAYTCEAVCGGADSGRLGLLRPTFEAHTSPVCLAAACGANMFITGASDGSEFQVKACLLTKPCEGAKHKEQKCQRARCSRRLSRDPAQPRRGRHQHAELLPSVESLLSATRHAKEEDRAAARGA